MKYASTFMLFIALAATSAWGQTPFSGTYNFGSVTTSSGLTDPTPVPTASGVTFSSFTAVGQTAANSNAASRFSFIGQPTGATNGSDVFTGSISTSQYYQVSVTVATNYTVTLSSITFTIQRSGTGIRQYSVRSSGDSYANNLLASVSNAALSVVATNVFQITDATTTATDGSSITLSGSSFTDLTAGTTITFRFYGWNAEAATGTFSIDNVVISGTAAYTAPVTDYYLASSGNAESTASWGVNTDGTGGGLTDFTTDNQYLSYPKQCDADNRWELDRLRNRIEDCGG